MAKASERPRIDVHTGLSAFEEDLPRVLRTLDAQNIEDLGWSRPNKMTLLVPMDGTYDGRNESFLLKLGFHAYRQWPPSAQFINPETRGYSYPQDKPHVPKLTSPECHSHVEYNTPGGDKIQLICCSATLEFYEVLHSVEAHHVWNERNTFLVTIMAIRRALAQHFQGRFSNEQ